MGNIIFLSSSRVSSSQA